ncbi:hypothetical protein AVEN_190224-1 [Araneus ventricosus]|uniref:Uncharacterized protein n=1 Tax=Araneus ventricosus TaxID=182803 RepID=A0A4Y2FF18_ARAVE|nr:hypothetical protein AVEN_190224-1 [Araneus ventricosus]
MEAPCKRYKRSLQSPRANVPTPPPTFQTGPPPRFPDRASLFSPYFVDFVFMREARYPLPTIVFQIYGLVRRMKIQPFRQHRAIPLRILELTTGFRTTVIKWCGTERS